MGEAPKEIWCSTGLYYEYKTDWSEGEWSARPDSSDVNVKYVRADRIEELEDKLSESEALLAKAVAALEFYGNKEHYVGEYIADECGCCGSWYEPKIHKDGEDSGDLARTTLAELSSVICANSKGETE